MKKLIPRQIKVWLLKRSLLKFRNLNNRDIFNTIYSKGLWGSAKEGFSSGLGTQNSKTLYYINTCVDFIKEKDIRTVLDIGCGDFSISRSIVNQTNIEYLGVDVASKVIEYNNVHFSSDRVKFKSLDATIDILPKADLITIRQVLQHLSNEQIMIILDKALKAGKNVIITEHLLDDENILPNIDKSAGPDVRIYFNSGVYIDKPPFNVVIKEKLLEYKEDFNVFGKLKPAKIRTFLVEGDA
ncbi:MAG: class I SAM-dependent methyltransferase [Chitinophagaceae bacterium]